MTRHLQALPDVPKAPKPVTRFSSVPEVAVALNVSEMTIRRMIDRGELPAYKFGKKTMRVPTQAVWDYIRGSKIDPDDFSKSDRL